MLKNFLTFLIPFAIGGVLAVYTVPSASVDFKAKVWLIMTLAGVVLVGVLRNRATGGKISVRFNRAALKKSLLLLAGWAFVFIVAAIQTQFGVATATVFFDDMLPVVPLAVVAVFLYAGLMEGGGEANALVPRSSNNATCWRDHRKLLLSWLVKAFFLPLMYGTLVLAFIQLLEFGLPSSANWIPWLFFLGLAVDVLIGTTGYICTARIFRSEVISIEPHWFGWAVCLICYEPFNSILHFFTRQTDNSIWTDWLAPDRPLYWIWAALIVLSWIIYWLSTVAFGFRFANLSYRGLVDIGPYRYCKHPAYLAKNIYWWLHTVPFFGVSSPSDMIRNFAGMSLLSLVYFLRAKTEERHLVRFPEYIDYSRRVDFFWRELLSRFQLRWRRVKIKTG